MLYSTHDLEKKNIDLMTLGALTWLVCHVENWPPLLQNRVSETRFSFKKTESLRLDFRVASTWLHVAVITSISSLLDLFIKIESIRLDFHVYSSHSGCHGGSVRILKPSLWGSVYNLKIEPQRLEMLEI